MKGEGGREGEGENEGGRGEEREQGFCGWVLLLIRNFKKSKKKTYFSLSFFSSSIMCFFVYSKRGRGLNACAVRSSKKDKKKTKQKKKNARKKSEEKGRASRRRNLSLALAAAV